MNEHTLHKITEVLLKTENKRKVAGLKYPYKMYILLIKHINVYNIKTNYIILKGVKHWSFETRKKGRSEF